MTHRAEGAMCRNAGLVLPALLLFAFPVDLLRVVAWTWVLAAMVMLLMLTVALAVRYVILPYANPELYRLATGRPVARAPVPRS